jgi:leucyl/phenylalanyl-tRNA--protein transferase
MSKPPDLNVELLLQAYAHGVFPMARRRDDDEIYFVSPEERGIIPLDTFHVPHRLARTVRSDRFAVRIDSAFHEVITACAEAAPDREDSWINAQIVSLYSELHRLGRAHSVECWREGQLVGGLYGVSLGGAFFGESMFSRERDASKVALVHLAAQLIRGGFALLDTQFLTGHLAQFGAVEISRAAYLARLNEALSQPAYWPAPSGSSTDFSVSGASGETGLTGLTGTMATVSPGASALQLITQAS